MPVRCAALSLLSVTNVVVDVVLQVWCLLVYVSNDEQTLHVIIMIREYIARAGTSCIHTK